MSDNEPDRLAGSSVPNELSHPSQGLKKHPCVLCQQRKVKCDRNDPCANCTKSRAQCISPATLPPRRRKKRFPEAELLARLRRYEEHLKRSGADLDAINRGGGSAGPSDTSSTIKASPPESPIQETVKTLSARRSLKRIEKYEYLWGFYFTKANVASNLWVGMTDEVAQHLVFIWNF
jgi:hypothetical protein